MILGYNWSTDTGKEPKITEASLKTADFGWNWAEFAEKTVVSPTNSNLYHYAGNIWMVILGNKKKLNS